MSTPPQFLLSRLSRQLYVDFLAKAKERGFSFVRFQDFLPGAAALPSRYIALRHDVDFAPAYSLDMAELEHAAGVVFSRLGRHGRVGPGGSGRRSRRACPRPDVRARPDRDDRASIGFTGPDRIRWTR